MKGERTQDSSAAILGCQGGKLFHGGWSRPCLGDLAVAREKFFNFGIRGSHLLELRNNLCYRFGSGE